MSQPSIRSITCEALHAISRERPVDLIDVRTPEEFREARAAIARNVPLDQFDAEAVSHNRKAAADEPIYIICQVGGRSAKACAGLAAAGCKNVVNVEGGTAAWVRAGLPVHRGGRAISIERQVRLVLGSIVLASCGLGWLVHPWWYAVAAFIGAGMIFTGLTDICGTRAILAKMPWNR
jgi:rhodanese-related sulfurtransferase